MTRRRTRLKTRSNKKPQGLNPCTWRSAQGAACLAGSSADGQGWIDTTDCQAEVLKHVTFYENDAPERKAAHTTNNRISEFILAARKDEQSHFF